MQVYILRHNFSVMLRKIGNMKPLVEFVLACMLIMVAGCSAIAGIFNAGIWTAIFIAGSVIGLVVMFAAPKGKQ